MAPSMTAVFLAAVPATVVARQQANPLGQVFALMDELSAKITTEGEAEEKAYKEYFAWCDDVNKNGHFAIKTASSQKDTLEARISELAANIKSGGSKIEDLAASIATAEGELEAATTIREQERSEFSASEKELVETVDTVGRAVKIIEKEMAKNPAAFAQVANKGFASVMSSLSTVVDAAGFSASDQQRLTALVQSQQKDDDDDAEFGAPSAAAYKSQSSGIVDTLEDLKEKAEGELSDVRKAETAASHNFQMLKQSLVDQLGADNKDLDAEKSGKTAAEEGKATAEGDLTVTGATLQNAEGELATANQNCMQVAADHGETVKGREEELKVIAQAKKIIQDATSGGADSFIEMVSDVGIRTDADLARSEIVTLVKKLARTHHSAALAQLASRIAAVLKYGARDDPFAKVKELISDMVSKLQEEAAAEATEKAYCDEEMAKSESKKGELDSAVGKLTTKIDQSTSHSAELKEDVKELQGELAALAKEQAEMDQMRQETHADYVQAKEDLELGLTGVRKAVGVLREYYSSAAAAAALVQDGIDQPAMPAKHSKAGGAGESIINILEVCESDFASNLAKEETTESMRVTAYEQNTQENKITKTTNEQDVKYKSQEATRLDKTIAELSSDRDTSNTELSAVNEYYDQLKGRCIAKPETYEERKQRRTAEISGLKEALSIIESQTALVQRKGKNHHGRHSFLGQ